MYLIRMSCLNSNIFVLKSRYTYNFRTIFSDSEVLWSVTMWNMSLNEMCFCLQLYGNQMSIVDDLSAWLIFVLISHMKLNIFNKSNSLLFVYHAEKKLQLFGDSFYHQGSMTSQLCLHTNHTIDTIRMSNLKTVCNL